ncbi:MAG: GTPase Era [Candidatus Rokubacteria bacterium]|nr:GTPase Era [Candidatus Rokubacteria bacterium]
MAPPSPDVEVSGSSRFRAGFVCLLGRPNVGKSTLLNRLVGEKLAIVSARPQTTRTRITGIKNLPGAQVVFVDTPGLHEPTGPLGRLMVKTVHRSLDEVDLVCLVAPATENPSEIDEVLLKALAAFRGPVFCCLNKADLVRPKTRLLPTIAAYQHRFPFREVVPISAADGTNCSRLLELIAAVLPEHPPYFPPDALTDQPETFFVAETIREKIFRFTRAEVPYACAVRVEELTERREPERLYIRASIFVEHASQRGILIGRGGAMLKKIGSAARGELEAFFGIPVYLDLRVEVRRNWRRDERALRELGFMFTS